MRNLELSGSSADEIRNFEFNCLGEVRLLNVLKHPCIVEILGHQLSTKWLPSPDGTPENRILQSAIFMEHVKGGSLKVSIINILMRISGFWVNTSRGVIFSHILVSGSYCLSFSGQPTL